MQPSSLSMFEAYVNEREGALLLKHEHGFGIYKDLEGPYAYLQDVYVVPEHRQRGVGRSIVGMALQQAKKSNKTTLLTTTDISTAGATQSAISILKVGFNFFKLEETLIWYSMEIYNG